jgi:hypothetical protein
MGEATSAPILAVVSDQLHFYDNNMDPVPTVDDSVACTVSCHVPLAHNSILGQLKK